MTRLWPSLLGLARVVEPATILRWHRAGFRTYWCWKSRGRAERPRIEHELRDLIRRRENPLWGAPRTHGELLKLSKRNSSEAKLSVDSTAVYGSLGAALGSACGLCASAFLQLSKLNAAHRVD